MTLLQNRHPKGTKGAGQFAGVEHQYAEVRLRMENAGGPAEPIDAGIAHARFMANATTAYAGSEALSRETREVFAVQAGVARAYVGALENLQGAGLAGPDGFLDLADTYDAKADTADKERAWTKKTRRANATMAGEYRYLSRTLRKLAAGDLPPAGLKASSR